MVFFRDMIPVVGMFSLSIIRIIIFSIHVTEGLTAASETQLLCEQTHYALASKWYQR